MRSGDDNILARLVELDRKACAMVEDAQEALDDTLANTERTWSVSARPTPKRRCSASASSGTRRAKHPRRSWRASPSGTRP